MDCTNAQIDIALLESIERQANVTAAALERVIRLMREVEEIKHTAKGGGRAGARPSQD